jgi:MYXO-CTERM domain-containing protein
LSVSVDGGNPMLWMDFGSVSPTAEQLPLNLPCPGFCFGIGPHSLEISALIAGESLAPAPLETEFTLGCDDETGGTCSVASAPGARGSPWALAALFWALVARLRRRHRPAEPPGVRSRFLY